MSFDFKESYIPPAAGGAEDLPVQLISCGHEIVSGTYSWNGLKRGGRRLAIWQYTLKGQGCIRVGTAEHEVPPGSGFIALVPGDHCYYLPRRQPSWEFVYVTLGGEGAIELAEKLYRRRGAVFPVAADSSAVAAVWSIIEAGRRNAYRDCYAASSSAYDFMMKLFRDDGGNPAAGEDRLLTVVRNYCQNRISEPLHVDDLARAAGLSRWYFSRTFRRISGKSPACFIVELKMDYALRLLQASTDPLKVVGERCGFSDASYFCRVFRRVFGTTPDGFRSGTALAGGSPSGSEKP